MSDVLTPPSEDNGNERADSLTAACSHDHYFWVWVEAYVPEARKNSKMFSVHNKYINSLSLYNNEPCLLNLPSEKNFATHVKKYQWHRLSLVSIKDIESGFCSITFEDFYSEIYSEIDENIESIEKIIKDGN